VGLFQLLHTSTAIEFLKFVNELVVNFFFHRHRRPWNVHYSLRAEFCRCGSTDLFSCESCPRMKIVVRNRRWTGVTVHVHMRRCNELACTVQCASYLIYVLLGVPWLCKPSVSFEENYQSQQWLGNTVERLKLTAYWASSSKLQLLIWHVAVEPEVLLPRRQ
jgi:hypothetical protein